MADLTETNPHYQALLHLHQTRHQDRKPERIVAEVRDFLRRAFRLPPDARTPDQGGLHGLTAANAKDAMMLATRNPTDLTTLYRPSR